MEGKGSNGDKEGEGVMGYAKWACHMGVGVRKVKDKFKIDYLG